MSGVVPVAVDLLAAVALLAGGLAAGAVGLLGFPDVLARLQAAGKPRPLGFVLVGVAPVAGGARPDLA